MDTINEETRQLYRLLRNELRTPPYTYHRIKGLSLRELDFTRPEINWFLNQVEWNFGIEVEEDQISLDTSLEDFFKKISARSTGRTSSLLTAI